jgi:pyridinium-3,5-biscarboxylic acid mononucleotide sulfurtransferase
MTSELDQLTLVLRGMGPVAVAVSGGVDSLTLAQVAHVVHGREARMHHAVSPAVPPEATARTRALAAANGWALDIFDAGEFADEAYRANPVNRCFFCKTNLYGALAPRALAQIVSGTNTDDLGEYRPGLQAAENHGVRHPYVEAGIDKPSVRRIAAEIGLGALAELPAAPCLSSRLETGIRVEPELLVLVHRAEQMVSDTLSPNTVRCRVRAGGIVIELDRASLERLDEAPALSAELQALARQPVTFAPYRTGSAFLHESNA